MADDNFYMKQALAEANAAYKQGEIPIGAVVVCRDKIIAKSHNLTELLHDVTAHAEMQAITSAAEHLGGKYLNDCTLYVTVELEPSGGHKSAELSMEHPMKSVAFNVLRPKPCTLEQRSRAA